jgi:hypothetical protein
VAAVKCLVKELGADINITAYNGSKPLMAAPFCKYADIVRWMVKEGADTQAHRILARWHPSRKGSGHLPSRLRTSRPRHPAPTPAAAARGSRGVQRARRRGTVASHASRPTGRHTRATVRVGAQGGHGCTWQVSSFAIQSLISYLPLNSTSYRAHFSGYCSRYLIFLDLSCC